MCLGILFQLQLKTGRLKSVFSLLYWLVLLFKHSEAYAETLIQNEASPNTTSKWASLS